MATIAELVQSRRTLLIAHRGNCKVAPENTLTAFSSALDVGVDCIELDTHESSDGVPMVIHDKMLDRTTNGRTLWHEREIAVLSKTAKQISELDAGSWFDSKFADARIPKLAEAVDLVTPRAMLMIERKGGSVENVLRVIREKKALDRITLHAFDWDFIAEAHRQEPKLVLGALGEKEMDFSKIAEAASIGATIINWKAADLTRETIAMAHEIGLRVWSWTVDEPAVAQRLLDGGINGLISNVPAKIKAILS